METIAFVEIASCHAMPYVLCVCVFAACVSTQV